MKEKKNPYHLPSILSTAFRARVAVLLVLAESGPFVEPISVLRSLKPIRIYITVMTVIGRKKNANVDT
jgi:hypothetical protein